MFNTRDKVKEEKENGKYRRATRACLHTVNAFLSTAKGEETEEFPGRAGNRKDKNTVSALCGVRGVNILIFRCEGIVGKW